MKITILAIGFLAVATSFSNAAPSRQGKDLEEIPDLTEGDMIVPSDLIKNGMIGEKYRWPNATVVYQLDTKFNVLEEAAILFGWAEISNATCIKFRPRLSEDSDYVFVQKGADGSGCFSSVGRQGGQQTLNYEASCVIRHGTVVHEMLHTIGFRHEQSRPDRDDFINVIWDKIQPGKENNFLKYETSEVTTFGAPYDYGSVLHYSGFGFSIDGSATIVPKIPGVEIGQRIGMSQLDAGKVMLMYDCPLQN